MTIAANPQTKTFSPGRRDPAAATLAPLWQRYLSIRQETERRAAPLSPEDQVVQSMPDASPIKWHRAHVTWFWEQFVLGPHMADYRVYHPDYAYIFNSYYVAAGPRYQRAQRGLLTRPGADDVTAYRAYVDAQMVQFLQQCDAPALERLTPLIEVGLNHEQQHQELMLTDILHAFSQNPIPPAYDAQWRAPACAPATQDWLTLAEGIHTIGHVGDDFHFDNEKPPFRTLINPVRIARNLVTAQEWRAFMEDGGYQRPELWLMDGHAAACRDEWQAPAYWRQVDGEWRQMTLGGLQPIAWDQPVMHISYYEADAFARWRGAHLPTEMEWEVAARSGALNDAFGLVWQWTRSAYSPYPGYAPIAGALGEYNGKFMVNQWVLRGSSLATPAGHSRISYRNFFYPQHRWQFTGLRLASYT